MKKVINYKVEGEQWTNAQDKAFEKLNKNEEQELENASKIR